MQDNASVYGNTADRGGGVFVSVGSDFSIIGGTVYGSNATGNKNGVELKNTAISYGASLFVYPLHVTATATYGGADGKANNFNTFGTTLLGGYYIDNTITQDGVP